MMSFELTMPNIGSWNGKWTGQDRKHWLIKKLGKKKEEELDGEYFRYDFGDGWSAGIKCEKILSKEANKRRKNSCGFCGYDWMVSEILSFGRIKTRDERIAERNQNETAGK